MQDNLHEDSIVVITDQKGVIRYLNQFGQLHRDGNLPAVIGQDYTHYYDHGELHRDHGPAVINSHQEVYYKHGSKHRVDGPAVIHFTKDPNKNKEIMSQEYFQHDVHHREDGPAIMWSTGSYQYYKNGLLHNDNGPACHWGKDGETKDEYWLEGKQVSKMVHQVSSMRKKLFSKETVDNGIKMQR